MSSRLLGRTAIDHLPSLLEHVSGGLARGLSEAAARVLSILHRPDLQVLLGARGRGHGAPPAADSNLLAFCLAAS